VNNEPPRALPGPAPDPAELHKRINQEIFSSRDALPEPMPTSKRGRMRWFVEKFANWTILILAIVNLALVFFDFTYLEMRPQYMQHAPALVAAYDPVKGVEPHRVTEAYLAEAERTFALLQADPASPAAQKALGEMRNQSSLLIAESPFAEPRLIGFFEQAKNRMRRHMHLSSARAAFNGFWSEANLTTYRLQAEAAFFRGQVAPLIQRNYYRAIGENGRPFDAFWKIDMLFIPFFLLEFLIRGIFGIRRGVYRDWGMFAATRWYDLVYFVPLFGYAAPALVAGPLHLVRFISVAYRMQRLGLINPLVVVQPHTDRVVDLVTDLVNIKLLSNYQDSIRKMDLAKMADSMTDAQRDALTRSIDRSLTTVVERVLPKASPELEALISRSVYQALDNSPAFQGLKRLPLLGNLHAQLVPAMVAEVMAGAQAGMLKAVHDPESRRLAEAAIHKISMTLIEELSRSGTEAELKEMAVQVLEEQKKKIIAGT
jgi:hypothetical protein